MAVVQLTGTNVQQAGLPVNGQKGGRPGRKGSSRRRGANHQQQVGYQQDPATALLSGYYYNAARLSSSLRNCWGDTPW